MERRQFLRDAAHGVAAFALAPLVGLELPRAAAQNVVNVDGVRFANAVEAAGTTLRLHRAVLFRYRRLFRAYRAGLYLGEGVEADAVLANVPKRLELSYCVSIEGDDFGPAADTILARMYSAEQLAGLRDRLDQLHAAYRSVRADDRYALTNVPSRGLELALNGRPLITIPGADFQRAYFAIWFGRRPLSASLRDELLGRAT